MVAAGEQAAVGTRRRQHKRLNIGGDVVSIRDQAPLHLGNARLEGGWVFDDLVRTLNARVFFWPGTDIGPVSSGVRHFARYESEGPSIIRIKMADMLAANPDATPLFCKFNSGSPRCTSGKGSPRGPSTFVSAENAPFRAAECVEVTFVGGVQLPRETFESSSSAGPWKMLFG
jgi:hypothetical protein